MSVSQIQSETAMWMNLKNNVKLKKQDTREYILFDSICINPPKEAKHEESKAKAREGAAIKVTSSGRWGTGTGQGPSGGARLCSGWMRGGHGVSVL